MLSLGNAFSLEDFTEWHRHTAAALRDDRFAMTAELKIDGLACRLEYRNHELVRAVTRGDGHTGEDVTGNVRTVRGLPHVLRANAPADLDVRGEVYLPVSEFQRVNKERIAAGLDPYANPRNAGAGAGAVRQHDTAVAASKKLRFWGYTLAAGHPGTLASQSAGLDALSDYGIPVENNRRVCHDTEEVAAYHQEIAGATGPVGLPSRRHRDQG